MTKTLLLAPMFLVWAGDVQGQHSLDAIETTAIYLAILQNLPSDVDDRAIVLDPRVSSSSLGDVSPVDAWERDLATVSESPVVQALYRRVAGLRYCAETPGRMQCLRSAQHVHVTLGPPVLQDSMVTVEITLAARASDERNSFDIQTWRYSLDVAAKRPVLVGRVLLARGHGRIGGR